MSKPAEKILSELDIHRIEIPSPYSTGSTNAYLIGGETPTLIDTGMDTGKAYEALAAALSQLGRKVKDVRRIILTHGHADHRALAQGIAEESGAEVLLHPLQADKALKRSTPNPDAKRDWIEIFRSMGVPEEHIPGLVEESKAPLIDADSVSISFADEGDEIEFDGFKLKVLHTPGHSCGSICLHEERSGVLFSGDTLLSGSHITAMLELDLMREDPEYNSLKLHMDSLRRLVELNAAYVLPGHGEMFCEYADIVEELRDRHGKRRRHILRSLRNGPRSLYQICRSTFLFVSADDLYLSLSEVWGNLGILMEQDKVLKTHDGRIAYYEKA